MPGEMEINGRKIGEGHPTYIVAEMSSNHNQDFEVAVEIVRKAKEAGADAIKLQTYRPESLTIPCDNEYFTISEGTWKGKNLFELYKESSMPYEWQPRLREVAEEVGIDFFSTVFDKEGVQFLEKLEVLVHKISSFEMNDLELIEEVASTGKPMIISTGMAKLSEIERAVTTAREAGCRQLLLLKCNSSYPADPSDMNLRTIPHLAQTFDLPVGLSDHTRGTAVPTIAVTLGASMVEKHFTLSRLSGGPDSSFSLEPDELRELVTSVRLAEKSLGEVSYGPTEEEQSSLVFRRSLFAIEDIDKEERLTRENIAPIRPGFGLPPRCIEIVLGRKAVKAIRRGTPLDWGLID